MKLNLNHLKTVTYKNNTWGYDEEQNLFGVLINNKFTTEIPVELEEEFIFIKTNFHVIWKFLTDE